jgi:hypothetical protein
MPFHITRDFNDMSDLATALVIETTADYNDTQNWRPEGPAISGHGREPVPPFQGLP